MGLMLWRLLPQGQAVTPIGTVDGLEITQEELLLYAEGHRAAVAKHFAEACGVKVVQNFWSASFDGECPGEMVKERALADLKRTKTEQKCMLEQGILSDADYDGFLQEFFEENRRRRETVAAGGTLYGPEEYSEREFFLLLHEKRRDALIQKLAKTAFSITGRKNGHFISAPDRKMRRFCWQTGHIAAMRAWSLCWKRRLRSSGIRTIWSNGKNRLSFK